MTDHTMTSAPPETGGTTFRVRDRVSGEWRYLSAKHFVPEETHDAT